jgi:hypothetical protein
MRKQYGHEQAGEYTLRGAAEHEIAQPRMTVTAHDEQLATPFDSGLLKRLGNRAVLPRDRYCLGVDTALAQG